MKMIFSRSIITRLPIIWLMRFIVLTTVFTGTASCEMVT
jgi:hypothetical protein